MLNTPSVSLWVSFIIRKGRLIDEINALEEVINSDLWESIKTVKDYGNIGDHMEKDINVIVDVDAEEAEKLIGLIELLFEEWYINREERKNRIKSLVDMGKEKKEEIKKARESKE